jgi:hypothetical protein
VVIRQHRAGQNRGKELHRVAQLLERDTQAVTGRIVVPSAAAARSSTRLARLSRQRGTKRASDPAASSGRDRMAALKSINRREYTADLSALLLALRLFAQRLRAWLDSRSTSTLPGRPSAVRARFPQGRHPSCGYHPVCGQFLPERIETGNEILWQQRLPETDRRAQPANGDARLVNELGLVAPANAGFVVLQVVQAGQGNQAKGADARHRRRRSVRAVPSPPSAAASASRR